MFQCISYRIISPLLSPFMSCSPYSANSVQISISSSKCRKTQLAWQMVRRTLPNSENPYKKLVLHEIVTRLNISVWEQNTFEFESTLIFLFAHLFSTQACMNFFKALHAFNKLKATTYSLSKSTHGGLGLAYLVFCLVYTVFCVLYSLNKLF